MPAKDFRYCSVIIIMKSILPGASIPALRESPPGYTVVFFQADDLISPIVENHFRINIVWTVTFAETFERPQFFPFVFQQSHMNNNVIVVCDNPDNLSII